MRLNTRVTDDQDPKSLPEGIVHELCRKPDVLPAVPSLAELQSLVEARGLGPSKHPGITLLAQGQE